MDETEPNGALYRVNGTGVILRMLPGVIVSNGLGWSPDDKIMYFTDSGHGAIYAFDFDAETGEIDNRREFARVAPADGMPDGLAVDAQGFVSGAHWGGWRITRYDPAGRTDRVIDMPVPRVTIVASRVAGDARRPPPTGVGGGAWRRYSTMDKFSAEDLPFCPA